MLGKQDVIIGDFSFEMNKLFQEQESRSRIKNEQEPAVK
jgi:hypothetical protein